MWPQGQISRASSSSWLEPGGQGQGSTQRASSPTAVPGDDIRIHCTITESHLAVPPIWLVESDDPDVAAVLMGLSVGLLSGSRLAGLAAEVL